MPVVLYRRDSGEVVAMEDRCIHRAYPLSDGRRDGDRVVCGYHGFGYDPDGCLVDVPSQENVPPGARVRTYPVHEQSPFVWIWLGDPGVAALRPPPRVPWYADGSGWASTTEVLRVEANYLLLHEHYLDLTDVFVMHPEVVPPDIEVLPPLDEVEVSERSVSYSRTTAAQPARRRGRLRSPACPPTLRASGVRKGHSSRRRCMSSITSSIPRTEKPMSSCGFRGSRPNLPAATHVFLQMARNYATDNDAASPSFSAPCSTSGRREMRLCWRRFSVASARTTVPRRDINVKADRAAVRARRIAMEMVDEESGRFALHRMLVTP